MELRRQALEDERRRREQLERRLQDETARRQKLVEKEVKLREKHFSQVRGGLPSASSVPAWLVCRQGLQLLLLPAGSAGPCCFPRLVP